jgi:hypothetical protein
MHPLYNSGGKIARGQWNEFLFRAEKKEEKTDLSTLSTDFSTDIPRKKRRFQGNPPGFPPKSTR